MAEKSRARSGAKAAAAWRYKMIFKPSGPGWVGRMARRARLTSWGDMWRTSSAAAGSVGPKSSAARTVAAAAGQVSGHEDMVA